MNRYQKTVATVAAFNILLMLLFPPFLDNPMGRMTLRSFESFYPVFAVPVGRTLYQPLLILEIAFVLANALAAWLALNSKQGPDAQFGDAALARGLVWFAVVDFAIIGLFPPFEPYSSLVKYQLGGFDGFYFLFGDKWRRQVFGPLLYLEITLIAIDLLVVWLTFGLIRRRTPTGGEDLLAAATRPPQERAETLMRTIETEAAQDLTPRHFLGRGADRRHCQDPAHTAPERRDGKDRRHSGS
jgi:hypothetical protein